MAIWTREDLHDLVSDRMADYKFIAVSNREPYIHWQKNGSIECMQPASGLATALDPIMRASGGVWVAHGSGSADRQVVDKRDHVAVPPHDPSYTLRRVWLPKKLEAEYYCGLANEGLWPLCHIAFHRPKFNQECWDSYRAANEIFAEAVLEEAADKPAFVFIQDYHLGLLPRMLKSRNPQLVVAQFWHIPWPNRETFRTFPWKDELLDGMLGNDLLGFHLRYHCQNFLETVDRNLESLVDTEHSNIKRTGHVTMVRPFPISIDYEYHNELALSREIDDHLEWWYRELGRIPKYLGVGIDRIDYTKGISERLAALDVLLENHSEYVGQLVFVQVGVPSRTGVMGYDTLNESICSQVKAINSKWRRGSWEPIHFIRRHLGQQSLIALHRLADFCVVSSLHDGMNLVAKEFVASRYDEDGVLVLSSFTGAARELTDAVLVNPFSCDEIAAGIHQAITMPREERRRRMVRMRSAVESNNIYRWAGKILQTLLRIEAVEPANDVSERPVSMAGAA
jgi:trehalose 6-phosphate synthase